MIGNFLLKQSLKERSRKEYLGPDTQGKEDVLVLKIEDKTKQKI
jgi:hypothetical protein